MTASVATVIINRDQAISLLEQAVEERGPGFVYTQVEYARPDGRGLGALCKYEDQGAPSCGVGLALHKAGVPLPLLRSLDKDPAEDTSIDTVAPILGAAGFTLTPDALTAFTLFQNLQDTGSTWGRALGEVQEA